MRGPLGWLYKKTEGRDLLEIIEAENNPNSLRATRAVSRLMIGAFGAMGVLGLGQMLSQVQNPFDAEVEPAAFERPVELYVNTLVVSSQLGGVVLAGMAVGDGLMLHRATSSKLRQFS